MWITIAIAVGAFFILLSTKAQNPVKPTVIKLLGNGFSLTEVMNSGEHQASFEKIIALRSTNSVNIGPRAHLTLENLGKVDRQAVRVSIDGFTVGHLSALAARDFRRGVARAGYQGTITFECAAVIRLGWARGCADTENHIALIDLPHGW